LEDQKQQAHRTFFKYFFTDMKPYLTLKEALQIILYFCNSRIFRFVPDISIKYRAERTLLHLHHLLRL